MIALPNLSDYEGIFIAFSGGLDSTVLLHAVASQPSLRDKLVAIHVNHGLSVNAMAWQHHCQKFCAALTIPLHCEVVHIPQSNNLEETARTARYQVFAKFIQSTSDCLLVGHHLDDQAETLLLNLLRGTGITGLAAMAVTKSFAQGQLVRPLLDYSRQDLQVYAHFHQLEWVNDESNADQHFSRNYIRHQILPLMSERWSGVVQTLARAAKHCQQAQINLEELANLDCPELKKTPTCLPLAQISHLPKHRLINVLRTWLQLNQLRLPSTLTFERLITELIQAKPDANPAISWDKTTIHRYKQVLYIVQSNHHLVSQTRHSILQARHPERAEGSLNNPLRTLQTSALIWPHFPQTLTLENLGYLCVTPSSEGLTIPKGSQIEVRFRQGGERLYLHKQTKPLKKLLQDWQIPPWQRDSIPLIYVNGQLACVVGYAISDHFYQSASDLDKYIIDFKLVNKYYD